MSGFKYLPVETRQTNIRTLVFPKLKQACWTGRLTSSGATCDTAWMKSPCLTLQLRRSMTATDPSPARIWWTCFRWAPSCWRHFLFRWHAPSCNDRYHNLRLWTPFLLNQKARLTGQLSHPFPTASFVESGSSFFAVSGRKKTRAPLRTARLLKIMMGMDQWYTADKLHVGDSKLAVLKIMEPKPTAVCL